jgi:hypothetical protein
MREPLVPTSNFPQERTISVDLLGRYVLVMSLNERPRAVLNVRMHDGGSLTLKGDALSSDWLGFTLDAWTGRAGAASRAVDDVPHAYREGVQTLDYDE